MKRTCDTSVLVPALAQWHPGHESARAALDGVDAVPAHVLFETYSVLTRLPSPHRIAPADAAAVVRALPFATLALDERRSRALIDLLGREGIRGGAVYDAVVAATALSHDLVLVTRDRRARWTYDVVGVRCAAA